VLSSTVTQELIVQFLYYSNLDNLQDGLSAAVDEGVIDAEQLENATVSDNATLNTATSGPSGAGIRTDLEGETTIVPIVGLPTDPLTATLEPAFDFAIDPELLQEPSYQSEKSKGKRPAKATNNMPVTSSATSGVQVAIESEKRKGKRPMNATIDADATPISTVGPGQRKKRKSLEGKPPVRYSQDPRHSAVPFPLLDVQKALFDEPADEMDLAATFDLFTSIPNDDKLLFKFRPGEWPVNEQCRSCGESVENIFQQKSKVGFCKAAKKERNKTTYIININGRRSPSVAAIQKLMVHVKECYPNLILDQHIDELLLRYPSHTFTNFHTAKPLRNSMVKGDIGYPLAKLRRIVFANAYNKASRLLRPDTYNRCQTCPEKPLLPTPNDAAQHQIIHGLYVPGDEAKLRDRRYTGEWTKDVIQFPTPTYYNITGRYHWDPRDHYDTAKKILQDIYWCAPATVDKFGRDPSILYEPGELSEDDNGLPTDTRYKLVLGLHEMVLAQARCVLCVNDPAHDPRDAAKPYNTTKNVISHNIFCVLTNFKLALQAKESYEDDPAQLPKPDHFLCRNGQLLCPDGVCLQNQRIFDNTLEMLQHFVAVHGMHVRGSRAETWSERPSLSSLTLPDQASMDKWLKEMRPSFASFADATHEGNEEEDEDDFDE